MNQILSIEMSSKRGTKSSVQSIVTVFAIFLILFGIGITATGAYSYYSNKVKKDKSNLVLIKNTKPEITIERQSASKFNIVVTHDKELKSIVYSINNGEKIEIPTENKTSVEQTVVLDSGTSTINITAEDINGVSSSYESQYEVQEKPKITLEQLDGQIKATVESKINIDTVLYYWDEESNNANEYKINDLKTETTIDPLPGAHTLIIKAKDVEGRETVETKKIIGVNKPILTVVTDGNEFIINAEDQEGLSKVEITFNSNEMITEEIDTNEYSKNIPLNQGENKLIVTVYNKKGLSRVSKVKYTKE